MAEGASLEQAMAVLDTYQRELEALARQLNFLQAVATETQRAREALEGLRKEPEHEILIPLGSNTFIPATVTQKERALIGIGAGLSVEKPWAEAEERLVKREAEIQGEMQRLSQAMVQLQQEAAALEDEVEQDIAAARSGGAMAGAAKPPSTRPRPAK